MMKYREVEKLRIMEQIDRLKFTNKQRQKQQQSIQEYNNKQGMDLQRPKKRSRANEKQQNVEQKSKKDLLRLQRDIFALKKSQEKDSQYVIRKLMMKKEKPEMSMMMESPVLSRLKEFMPIFHKSNEQLQQRPIEQTQKIDVRLQQCQSSSQSQSQSDDDNEQLMEDITEEELLEQQDGEGEQMTNNQINKRKSKLASMEIEVKDNRKNVLGKSYHHQSKSEPNAMDQEHFNKTILSKNSKKKNNTSKTNIESNNSNNNDNLIELNFLTYPYLNQQQVNQLNQSNQPQTNPIQQHIAQLIQKKQQQKVLIQQINSTPSNTQMEQ